MIWAFIVRLNTCRANWRIRPVWLTEIRMIFTVPENRDERVVNVVPCCDQLLAQTSAENLT